MGRNPFFFLLLPSSAFLLIVIGLSASGSRVGEEQTQEIISCNPSNFTGEADLDAKVALFEGRTIAVPFLSQRRSSNVALSILGVTSDRWIEVDLSEQKLRAWDGDQLFLETAISSGLPWWPTPTGEFRIWIKLRATKMEGGSGKYYYYLPNVPYVMYFWKGYGLHGTYWHNDFGTRRSHGCVNLPTPVAEKLFYWTGPQLLEDRGSIRADSENAGTRIVIHE